MPGKEGWQTPLARALDTWGPVRETGTGAYWAPGALPETHGHCVPSAFELGLFCTHTGRCVTQDTLQVSASVHTFPLPVRVDTDSGDPRLEAVGWGRQSKQ
jgi:hypothetical protein